MPQPTHIRMPPIALGMASAVLGVIALLLFFLPILGIPLSICGVVLGILGLAASWKAHAIHLRWSLAGVAVSSFALTVNAALMYAPLGYLRDPVVPRPWQSVPDRPFTSPPAKPSW